MVGIDSPTQSEAPLRKVPSTTSFTSSIYSGPQDHVHLHSPDPHLKPLKPALKHSYSHDSAKTTSSSSGLNSPSSTKAVLSPASLAPSGKRHPASPENSRPSSPALHAGPTSHPPSINADHMEVISESAPGSQVETRQLQQPRPRRAGSYAENVIPPTPIEPPASAPFDNASEASSSAAQYASRSSIDSQSPSRSNTPGNSGSSSADRRPRSHHLHFWQLGHHNHHHHGHASGAESGKGHPASVISTGGVATPASAPPAALSAAPSNVGEEGGVAIDGDAASRRPSTGWERKVGFDTMPDALETESQSFSFTLQAKSKGYVRTKNTRTFMVAADSNAYSERALEWLMEALVEDGDEVVALRVLEGEAGTIDQDEAREDANELLAQVVDLNEEIPGRKISIIIEFIAGRPTSTILRLIHMYRPDSLTVGTRGKSANALQKMLLGSASIPMGHVSRDLLSRSPVPVVVVRPEAKVQKHLRKRLKDPTRRGYHDLIKGSGAGPDLHALPMSVSKSKRESLHLGGGAGASDAASLHSASAAGSRQVSGSGRSRGAHAGGTSTPDYRARGSLDADRLAAKLDAARLSVADERRESDAPGAGAE